MTELLALITENVQPWIRIGGRPGLGPEDIAGALAKIGNRHTRLLLYKFINDNSWDTLSAVLEISQDIGKELRNQGGWEAPKAAAQVGLGEQFFDAFSHGVLREWVDAGTMCKVCKGADVYWHPALESRYGASEPPNKSQPILCPACFGCLRSRWTVARRHENIRVPGYRQFSKTWNSRWEDWLQGLYDAESLARERFSRALNGRGQ